MDGKSRPIPKKAPIFASDSPQSRGKAKLLIEWSDGANRYRLIAKANHTPGYEDIYFINILSEDDMGEPIWKRVKEWTPEVDGKSASVAHYLLKALKFVMSDQAERERLKASEVNHPMETDSAEE